MLTPRTACRRVCTLAAICLALLGWGASPARADLLGVGGPLTQGVFTFTQGGVTTPFPLTYSGINYVPPSQFPPIPIPPFGQALIGTFGQPFQVPSASVGIAFNPSPLSGFNQYLAFAPGSSILVPPGTSGSISLSFSLFYANTLPIGQPQPLPMPPGYPFLLDIQSGAGVAQLQILTGVSTFSQNNTTGAISNPIFWGTQTVLLGPSGGPTNPPIIPNNNVIVPANDGFNTGFLNLQGTITLSATNQSGQNMLVVIQGLPGSEPPVPTGDVVPEPSTLVLFALGALGLVGCTRRRRAEARAPLARRG